MCIVDGLLKCRGQSDGSYKEARSVVKLLRKRKYMCSPFQVAVREQKQRRVLLIKMFSSHHSASSFLFSIDIDRVASVMVSDIRIASQ